MKDQAYYDQVARELEQKEIDTGIWARAVAEGQGDERRTRAAYIRLRAEYLRSLAQTQQVQTTRANAKQVTAAIGTVGVAVFKEARLVFAGVLAFVLGVLTLSALSQLTSPGGWGLVVGSTCAFVASVLWLRHLMKNVT